MVLLDAAKTLLSGHYDVPLGTNSSVTMSLLHTRLNWLQTSINGSSDYVWNSSNIDEKEIVDLGLRLIAGLEKSGMIFDDLNLILNFSNFLKYRVESDLVSETLAHLYGLLPTIKSMNITELNSIEAGLNSVYDKLQDLEDSLHTTNISLLARSETVSPFSSTSQLISTLYSRCESFSIIDTDHIHQHINHTFFLAKQLDAQLDEFSSQPSLQESLRRGVDPRLGLDEAQQLLMDPVKRFLKIITPSLEFVKGTAFENLVVGTFRQGEQLESESHVIREAFDNLKNAGAKSISRIEFLRSMASNWTGFFKAIERPNLDVWLQDLNIASIWEVKLICKSDSLSAFQKITSLEYLMSYDRFLLDVQDLLHQFRKDLNSTKSKLRMWKSYVSDAIFISRHCKNLMDLVSSLSSSLQTSSSEFHSIWSEVTSKLNTQSRTLNTPKSAVLNIVLDDFQRSLQKLKVESNVQISRGKILELADDLQSSLISLNPHVDAQEMALNALQDVLYHISPSFSSLDEYVMGSFASFRMIEALRDVFTYRKSDWNHHVGFDKECFMQKASFENLSQTAFGNLKTCTAMNQNGVFFLTGIQ